MPEPSQLKFWCVERKWWFLFRRQRNEDVTMNNFSPWKADWRNINNETSERTTIPRFPLIRKCDFDCVPLKFIEFHFESLASIPATTTSMSASVSEARSGSVVAVDVVRTSLVCPYAAPWTVVSLAFPWVASMASSAALVTLRSTCF